MSEERHKRGWLGDLGSFAMIALLAVAALVIGSLLWAWCHAWGASGLPGYN
ncbi:MAG TPA: hypothetical protein VK843_07090 [Planctomycetota bacterium]|nr:hypothetical protein [Planctomycetota bacterium]